MSRTVEWALALVAVILTGSFLLAVTGRGGWMAGEGPDATRDPRYFHGGKTPPASLSERGCLSKGCHAGAPHAEDRTQAAFRNLHVRFIDCLVCHGRDSRKSWIAEAPAPVAKPGGRAGAFPRNRWKIAASGPEIDRERMHGSIGPALGCRACHSEEGYRGMTALGIRDLPSGFVNPVALRMIEEGGKQWIPDNMR